MLMKQQSNQQRTSKKKITLKLEKENLIFLRKSLVNIYLKGVMTVIR